MQLVTWVSPLHILKAGSIKAVVGELAEVEVVYSHSELYDVSLKDPLFAVPGFNPYELDVSWELLRRYTVFDWTPTTYIVTGYGYPPSSADAPVLEFEHCPPKATMNQILQSLDKNWVEKVDPCFYELLSVMTDGVEAVKVVGYALSEFEDVRTVVDELASEGVSWVKDVDPSLAFERFLELGLSEFCEEDLQDYANEVTTDSGFELIGESMVDLVTDSTVSSGSGSSVEEGSVVGGSSGTVSDNRPELRLDHVDWDRLYWADHLSGVREGD